MGRQAPAIFLEGPEYGLDHIVSRGVEPADTERLVPNPQKKALTQMYETVGHHAAFARNFDEGRSFLQRIFQQPADIIPNHDEDQLVVRPTAAARHGSF
jgi:hypothetical protein